MTTVVKFFDPGWKNFKIFVTGRGEKISKFFEWPYLIQNGIKFWKKIVNLYLKKIINLEKLLYKK